jgi:thiol-disulfide isomerase/thioredoxin
MKIEAKLMLLLSLIAVTARAQQAGTPLLNLGDPVPPLRVKEWIKGTPVQNFEKDKVYVVEFWATWCRPCMASLPRLSALGRKYKHKVTIVAIDVYEQKNTSIEKVKTVVNNMSHKMDFPVAAEDSNFMAHDWLKASDEQSIPIAFVVNEQGKVAWIGHPKDLHQVLPKILNHTWNIKDAKEEAINKRNLNKYLSDLDGETAQKLTKYEGDYYVLDDLGKPDSALLVINEAVKKEPKLKYAPLIASFTFTALLKTNQHQAFEYGKEVLMTPGYEGSPAFGSIIGGIKDYEHKLKISVEIYQLGTEAYRAEIDQCPYPELFNDPELYYRIANWYWLAGDKSKAIKFRRKANKLAKINLNVIKS